MFKIIIFTFFITSYLFAYSSKVEKLNKYYKNPNILYWIDKNHRVKKIAFELINEIEKDKVLEPFLENEFNIKEIKRLINTSYLLKRDEDYKILDSILTRTYDKYMTYLSKGFIKWQDFLNYLENLEDKEKIKAKWSKYQANENNLLLLKKAIKENNIKIAINQVDFSLHYAKKLEKKIEKLQALLNNGGYTKVPQKKEFLKKGDFSPEIKYLRQRLYESKDLNTFSCEKIEENCLEYFDNKLYKAVIQFQKRYGLIQDGVVGNETFEKLNMPIEEKIKKIRINLERMRWLPRNLGDTYILINIPEYKLKVFQENKLALKMNVIVGKQNSPTPIFSHRMSKITINPYWKIPQTIVKDEIIPKLVKDSSYLIKENIRVHENWEPNSAEFNSLNINWIDYLNNDLIGTPKKAPMRFIQEPGGTNPLGKIKFMFPNQYSVYLHDTPDKNYFKLNNRMLSHGCVRIEKPFELFEKISLLDKNINQLNKNIFEEKKETSFILSNKIPVHFIYLTTWVDEKDKLQFRKDIYEYDKIQERILFKSTFM